MRPNLARYTDREDDGLDEINEQGPKETLWVSYITEFFFNWHHSASLLSKELHISGSRPPCGLTHPWSKSLWATSGSGSINDVAPSKARYVLVIQIIYLCKIISLDRKFPWRKTRKDRRCTATTRHTSTHPVGNPNPQVREGQGDIWALRTRCISGKLFLVKHVFLTDMITHQRNAFQIAQGKDKDYWFVVDMELFQTRKLAQAKQDK